MIGGEGVQDLRRPLEVALPAPGVPAFERVNENKVPWVIGHRLLPLRGRDDRAVKVP
jgi:hypothetical protein